MEELENNNYLLTIDELPNEIIEYVLSFVSPYDDLDRCKLVCKRWNKICKNVHKLLQANFKRSVTNFSICCDSLVPFGEGPSITRRYSHCACVCKNSMYIFGGNTSFFTTFNDLWRLDLSTRKWVRPLTMGSYPSPKASATMVSYKNKLIVYGGWSMTSPHPLYQSLIFFKELHEYNIMNNYWRSIITTGRCDPPALAGHTATIHKDRMVVFGGNKNTVFGGESCETTSDVWYLNLKTFEWFKPKINVTTGGTSPIPARFGHTQIALDDSHLLIVGGSNNSQRIFQDVWLLDMSDDNEWIWKNIPIKNKDASPKILLLGPGCLVGNFVVFISHKNLMNEQSNLVLSRRRGRQVDGQQPQRPKSEATYDDRDINVNGKRGRLQSFRGANISSSSSDEDFDMAGSIKKSIQKNQPIRSHESKNQTENLNVLIEPSDKNHETKDDVDKEKELNFCLKKSKTSNDNKNNKQNAKDCENNLKTNQTDEEVEEKVENKDNKPIDNDVSKKLENNLKIVSNNLNLKNDNLKLKKLISQRASPRCLSNAEELQRFNEQINPPYKNSMSLYAFQNNSVGVTYDNRCAFAPLNLYSTSLSSSRIVAEKKNRREKQLASLNRMEERLKNLRKIGKEKNSSIELNKSYLNEVSGGIMVDKIVEETAAVQLKSSTSDSNESNVKEVETNTYRNFEFKENLISNNELVNNLVKLNDKFDVKSSSMELGNLDVSKSDEIIDCKNVEDNLDNKLNENMSKITNIYLNDKDCFSISKIDLEEAGCSKDLNDRNLVGPSSNLETKSNATKQNVDVKIESCYKETRLKKDAIGVYSLDVSQVLSKEPYVEWLSYPNYEIDSDIINLSAIPSPVVASLSYTIFYTLVPGNGEIIMFGGINTNGKYLIKVGDERVSNALYIFSAPRRCI